jgi:hypothetical protein
MKENMVRIKKVRELKIKSHGMEENMVRIKK